MKRGRSRPISRRRRTTPMPSRPGMCTSRKTTSGSSFRMSSTASRPLEPVAITSTSGKSRNRNESSSRPSGSSSTTTVVMVEIARSRMEAGIIAISGNRRMDLANHDAVKIAPADGKLGVLIPGIGAVTTTFIAGVEAIKRGMAAPVGSLTQLATIRLGKRTDNRTPMIKDFVPLAGLNDLVFGGWDIFEDTAYEAAANARVLDAPQLEKLKEPLSAIKPMKAVFDQEYVKRINGPNVKQGGNKMDKAEMLMDDIRNFQETNGVSRSVMIWCGSTEVFHRPAAVHQTLKDFECGLMKDDPEIAPSQIYAYAALKSGIPFANGAPNLTTDMPAMLELARERQIPICGKDFKTGQTLLKTLIAPGLKARMLGLSGWFSTNILGNRDG